ncbi:MAG TPA: S9 family peptidase, partial [Kineobactrum sp.]
MFAALKKLAGPGVLLLAALTVNPVWAASPFTASDVFQLSYASSPLLDSTGKQVLYLRHTMDIMRDQPRSNLWRVSVDGGDHRPVTTGPGNVSSPALAPDDNRVGYVQRDDTGPQLFVSWLDSGHVAQLTRLAEAPANLVWSPDGQSLAFRMLVPEQAPTIDNLPEKPADADWAEPPVVVERTVYRSDGSGIKPHGYQQVFVIP